MKWPSGGSQAGNKLKPLIMPREACEQLEILGSLYNNWIRSNSTIHQVFLFSYIYNSVFDVYSNYWQM